MKDRTRREFLKNCFQIGGYAGVACLGMGAIEDARGWGILPAVITSGAAAAAASYSAWLGTDQEGWTDSQANTNICLFDASGVGDDDYSTGAGLTGADLTFTESGAIVGAVGDPPYRQITDNDMYSVTSNYQNLITGTSWSIIIKLADLQNQVAGVDDFVFDFADGDAVDFQFMVHTNNTLELFTNSVSSFTVDTIVTTGNIWLAIWRRSSGNIKYGFVTTTGSGAHGQPTKESDFDANKIYDTLQAFSPIHNPWLDNDVFSQNNANGITAKAYYMIVSEDCLIAA